MGDNDSPFAGADSIGEIASILVGLEAGEGDGAPGEQAEAPARKPARRAEQPVADDSNPEDVEEDSGDAGATDDDEPDGTAQDDVDEAEAPEEEAEDEPVEDEDPTHTVVVDGKEVEVTLSELREGYQRLSDYTRKTQELAEQRKTLETEGQRFVQSLQSATEAATKRGEQFDVLFGALQDLIKEPDYDAIVRAYDDPDKGEVMAARAQRNYRQAINQLGKVVEQRRLLAQQQQAEAEKLTQEQQAKAAAEAQRAAKESLARLDVVIPEWRDRTRLRADVGQIQKLWEAEGGSPEILGNVTDPVVWKVLRGWMLHSSAKKTQAAVKNGSAGATTVKKVVKPLTVQKPGGTGPEERKRMASREQVARRNKVLATGKIDDIHAAVMGGLLDI